MKKITKLFFNLILFLFYANIANATTSGTYVVSENNTGKGFLIFIGIILIIPLTAYITSKFLKLDIAKIKERYIAKFPILKYIIKRADK